MITNDLKRLASLVTLNVFVQVDVHEKKNIPFLNVEKITNKLKDCDWICKKTQLGKVYTCNLFLLYRFYTYHVPISREMASSEKIVVKVFQIVS